MHEMQVWSLGWENPLEEGSETHPNILAWRIPWTEEPGGLQSIIASKSWIQLKWLGRHAPSKTKLWFHYLFHKKGKCYNSQQKHKALNYIAIKEKPKIIYLLLFGRFQFSKPKWACNSWKNHLENGIKINGGIFHLELPLLSLPSFSVQINYQLCFFFFVLSVENKGQNLSVHLCGNCDCWWGRQGRSGWHQVSSNDRKKRCADKRVRPSLFCVVSDSQRSTQGKCWLTKIRYYVKTIRVQTRKISAWEEYFWVKQLKSCQSRPLEGHRQPCWEKDKAGGEFPNTSPREPSTGTGDLVTRLSGGGFHFLNKPFFQQGLSQSALDTKNTRLTCPRRGNKSQCKQCGPEGECSEYTKRRRSSARRTQRFMGSCSTHKLHLARKDDSLEKTLILGNIEGKRRRGRQRTRLYCIANSMDMNVSKLWEMVMNRGAWRAAVHGVGLKESHPT